MINKADQSLDSIQLGRTNEREVLWENVYKLLSFPGKSSCKDLVTKKEICMHPMNRWVYYLYFITNV